MSRLATRVVAHHSSATDLERLLRWTGWPKSSVLSNLWRDTAVDEAFARGQFRILTADRRGEPVGLSVLSAAPMGSSGSHWELSSGDHVSTTECLFWIGLAVAPEYRRQGIGALLFERTLTLGVTTGYPFIVVTHPGEACHADPLFDAKGFRPVRLRASDAGTHRAYLRKTLLVRETAFRLPHRCKFCATTGSVAADAAHDRGAVRLLWRCETCGKRWPVAPYERHVERRRSGHGDRRTAPRPSAERRATELP